MVVSSGTESLDFSKKPKTSLAKHKKILFFIISPLFNSKLLFNVDKVLRDDFSKKLSYAFTL